MATDADVKPKRKRRRWFQFSLKTLLLAVVLVTLPLSWLAVKLDQKRRERRAIIAIQELNGWVTYDYLYNVPLPARGAPPEPPGPAWLRGLLGDDFFTDVVEVTLSNSPHADAALKHLGAFPNLRCLRIWECRITDAGLRQLGTLTNLESLAIERTQIGDVGMKHLTSLRNLKVVWLGDTDVTEEAVARFQQTLPDCEVICASSATQPAPSGTRFTRGPMPPFPSTGDAGEDPFAAPRKEPSSVSDGDPFGLPDKDSLPVPSYGPPSLPKPEPTSGSPTPK